MTAGREDGTTGEPGQLRTSHADRDQAINVLKAAFVQGRLTKHEFDLRVGQVLASRTYADLRALTADIPGWVTSEPEADEPAARGPGRALSFKTAARVGAVGAVPSMASATVAMLQSSGVPAVAGVLAGRPDRRARDRAAGRAAGGAVLGRAPLAAGSRAGTAVGSVWSGVQAPGVVPAAAVGEAPSVAGGRSGRSRLTPLPGLRVVTSPARPGGTARPPARLCGRPGRSWPRPRPGS